jgi:hypothetical protein
MRTVVTVIAATAAIAGSAFAGTRTEINYADLPETVREGFAAHQPAAQPEKAFAETENGATTYTIRDPQIGDNHSDTLNAAGEIFQCTHDLALADVPATVTAAARTAYSDSTLVDATVTYTHGEKDMTEYHSHLRQDAEVTCAVFSDTGAELEDPHMAAHGNGASPPP